MPVKNFVWRWLFSCLFILNASCKQSTPHAPLKLTAKDSSELRSFNVRAFQSIASAHSLVKQGDLILRTGNDFTSESLRQLSEYDKTYSHCGIASIENDSIFVYHALGGEWNPNEKLRRDPIRLFCNPFENRGFGVFRFQFLDKDIYALDSVVRSWYKKGYTFDMDFDLSTDEKLYCAEFVSKAITTATQHRINFTTTRINSFSFVAVDNLFKNTFCEEKLRVRFQ